MKQAQNFISALFVFVIAVAPLSVELKMERGTGIEPAIKAWEAFLIPFQQPRPKRLSERIILRFQPTGCKIDRQAVSNHYEARSKARSIAAGKSTKIK